MPGSAAMIHTKLLRIKSAEKQKHSKLATKDSHERTKSHSAKENTNSTR